MKYKKKRMEKKMESKLKAEQNENEQQAEENVRQAAAEEAPAQETETAETPTQEQWAEALKKTVEERDGLKDSYLRLQAEFANFKRRNATVRSDAFEDGTREAIAAVLPAIDNMELALKAAENAGETGAMYDGVKLTLKTLTDSLAKLGLSEVPALGEIFDPELHNAVMKEPGGTENQICEVFQKGYKVKDKMIRYAMVKVSSGEEA